MSYFPESWSPPLRSGTTHARLLTRAERAVEADDDRRRQQREGRYDAEAARLAAEAARQIFRDSDDRPSRRKDSTFA